MNTEVETMTKTVKQKFFTLDDANKSLVLVSRIVRDIQLQFEVVTKLRQEVKDKVELSQNASYVEVVKAKNFLRDNEIRRAAFEAGMEVMNVFIDELSDVGAIITDFNTGQIMFHGVRNGKSVDWRWKLGDKKISGYTVEGSNNLRRIP